MKDRNVFVCTRLRMLQYLESKGFFPFATEPDKYNPKYVVWLFWWTDELLVEVDKYRNHTKQFQ